MLRESIQINEDILGMFGVDPDPSDMTLRFRFGTNFGHAREGSTRWQERLCGQTRGTRKTWLVSERSTKARGDAATTSGCKFYENDADAMRMMT